MTPSDFEAHRGDVIRVTLKTGVHNLRSSGLKSRKTGLPPASERVQLPGQTIDIPVSFAAGNYHLQCDPHAALGMKRHPTVEDKDD